MPPSSKPVKPWRFIPFWPFVLVAILGLLWWQRIAIAGWLVGFAPLPGDWQITRLELDDITLDQVRIAQLDLVHRKPDHGNAEPLELAMGNILVAYQLFTENGVSVKSVDIGQARLSVSESESESGVTLGSMLRDVRELLQRPMPEISLNTDQLHVENSRQQVLADRLAVRLESTGDHVTTTVRYDDQQAILRIGSELEPTFTGQQSPPQQIAALSLIATESGVKLYAGLDLKKLRPIATELGILPAIDSDTLKLPGTVRLNLDLARSGNDVIADFTIQPLDIASGHTTISGVQGNGRVTVPASQKPGLPLTLHAFDGVEIKARHAGINETRLDGFSLDLNGVLTVNSDNVEFELTDQSRFRVSSAKSRLSDNAVQATELNMTPELSVTGREITLKPGFSIRANTLTTDGLAINNLSAAPIKPVILDRGFEPFSHQPLGNWHIESSARLSDGIAVDARLHINVVNPDPDQLDIKLVAEQLKVSAPWPIPAIDAAELDIISKGPVITGKGQVALAPLQNMLDITLDYDSGQNKTGVSAASSASEPVPSLLAMLDDYSLDVPPEIAVKDGLADFVAEAEWVDGDNRTNASFKLDLTGNAISGQIDDVTFQGLDLDINGALDSTGELYGTVDSTLDSIDYGLMIKEINSEFSFTHTETGSLPALDFQSLSGILFDSRFYSDPFRLDLNDRDTRLVVKVDRLDIAKLVEAQGIDHLSATGRVRGVFPVTVDQGGITVIDGTVTNLPGGGRIQYDLSDQQAAAMDNPLTDIVVSALRDFRYDVLTADTNYHPDGELFINFHLEGISPQLDPDRQVNLNINTQQNVLSLLRSLNYSDDLNQTIDQQIQDNMK